MANRFISRGFIGKRRAPEVANRVPPGQYLPRDFPVLSAGPTPRTPLDRWSFSIQGLVSEPVTWTWAEFLQLPTQTFMVDIHCVTKWSKLDTRWEGVSLDTLLEHVELDRAARYLTGLCDGGYTTTAESKKIEAVECRPQRGLTIDVRSIVLLFAIICRSAM